MRKFIIAALTAATVLVALPARAGAPEPLRYREVGGDGPVLIVRGAGCLQAEDSLELRVVSYTGDKVIYKCIAP